jgi:hypothetical protein
MAATNEAVGARRQPRAGSGHRYNGHRRSGTDTMAFGPSVIPRQDHPTRDVTDRRPMGYPDHHEPGSRTKKAIVEQNSRQAS